MPLCRLARDGMTSYTQLLKELIFSEYKQCLTILFLGNKIMVYRFYHQFKRLFDHYCSHILVLLQGLGKEVLVDSYPIINLVRT